jgi:hypothetical protein
LGAYEGWAFLDVCKMFSQDKRDVSILVPYHQREP